MVPSDEARFDYLYTQYRTDIQAYCARRTASDVQDLVAEVFLVAWRRIDQVPPGRDGLFWLYAVAFRLLKRHWRTYARLRRALERLNNLVDVDSYVPADVVVVQRYEYELVREAASRLKAIDQEVLRLTLWEELTHREVAEVLDIEVDAVKQRAHRARHRLGVEYRRLLGEPSGPSLIGKEAPR